MREERESEGEREPRESTTILRPRPAELLHSLNTYVDVVVHHARAVERPTRRAPPSAVEKGQHDKKSQQHMHVEEQGSGVPAHIELNTPVSMCR